VPRGDPPSVRGNVPRFDSVRRIAREQPLG
jgi:hypothetical protein